MLEKRKREFQKKKKIMYSLNYPCRNSDKSSLKIGSASIFGIPSPKMKQNKNVVFLLFYFYGVLSY